MIVEVSDDPTRTFGGAGKEDRRFLDDALIFVFAVDLADNSIA